MSAVIFVYKFGFAVWLIVYGVRDRHDDDLDSSSDVIAEAYKAIGWFLLYCFFVMIIFFRWFANSSQYNKEKRSSASRNLFKFFSCGCCKNYCWYIVSILNFCMDGILVTSDWTYSGWLTKVVISYVAWELFMICFMIAYKSYLIEEHADPVADLPNRHIIDHQGVPPPYHIYANNNLPEQAEK